ncbi:unnamed protein product [Effrenium voratum]|nr:unnamed protein product [Effrenium voratum]
MDYFSKNGEALPDRFIKRGQDRIRDLDSDSEPDSRVSFCFGRVLRLRFTQCEVCQTLKAQLHSSIGLELKLGALKAYRTHLEDTFQLWQLQSLSEDGHSSSVLTIVLDGMDQSKFAVPRDPALRAAASLANIVNPRMKLHGAWALGWTLDLHVVDEPVKKDSAFVIETIALALEKAFKIAAETGRRMPDQLVVIAIHLHAASFALTGDNCVRENKNACVMGYLQSLIAAHRFTVTVLAFLRKSHTRDRIDQLWGVLARRLSSCDSMQTDQDMVRIIQSECNRPGLRHWIGLQCSARVLKTNAVRDWSSHVANLGAHYAGGLLEDASSSHFFLSMLYKGGRGKFV